MCLGLVRAMTHAWVLIKTTIRKSTWLDLSLTWGFPLCAKPECEPVVALLNHMGLVYMSQTDQLQV